VAAASATEAVVLLDTKGRNREVKERPSVPTSKAPVAARILLEEAVAAELGVAAGADLLGPAGRGKGKKACAVTTKRSRAAKPGRLRGGGMFLEGFGTLTGNTVGAGKGAVGNEGSLAP
jgi:hypothetical protein